MGQRSRKRRAAGSTPSGHAIPEGTPSGRAKGGDLARGYARSRERAEATRAQLQPLAPGERPLAVTIAALVAGLIAVANLILIAVDADVGGRPSVTGGIVFAGIMAVAAVYMWRCRYWAVLGFQALLGLSVITASLALLVASNVEAVVRSVVVIAAAGTLFWFLIRAMARLQMPTRTR